MAKKQPAPKKGKAAGKGKARLVTKGKAGKPVARKPAARQPRNRSLPGMEHVRHTELDAICEGIGESLDTINTATTEKKGQLQSALTALRNRGIFVYKHAQVQVMRTPGDEKINAKRIKEEGDGGDLGDGSTVETANPDAAPDHDRDAGDDDE